MTTLHLLLGGVLVDRLRAIRRDSTQVIALRSAPNWPLASSRYDVCPPRWLSGLPLIEDVCTGWADGAGGPGLAN